MNDFNLTAPKGGSTFKPQLVPVGQHVAILVQIIDQGDQFIKNQHGEKWTRKVQFIFELPFEERVFDEDKGPQPSWVYSNFTFVISENSHLKAFYETATGNRVNKADFDKVNIGIFLGQPFIINVIHSPKGDGTFWQNVSSAVMVTEKNKPMYNINWDAVVAKGKVFGFVIDEKGDAFKSPLFGELGPKTQEKLLKSKQGLDFIASGGVAFSNQSAPVTKAQAPANVNPLQQGTQTSEPKDIPAGDMPNPNHFL